MAIAGKRVGCCSKPLEMSGNVPPQALTSQPDVKGRALSRGPCMQVFPAGQCGILPW